MSIDTKPSLQALSHALRHPETWPPGFIWDFNNCDTCAMELAHRLWESVPGIETASLGVLTMCSVFRMAYEDAANIFMGDGNWVPGVKIGGYTQADLDAVTSEMVADQIDAYLARQE